MTVPLPRESGDAPKPEASPQAYRKSPLLYKHNRSNSYNFCRNWEKIANDVHTLGNVLLAMFSYPPKEGWENLGKTGKTI